MVVSGACPEAEITAYSRQALLRDAYAVRLMPSASRAQVMQDIAARSRSNGGGGARGRDWLDDDEKVVATGKK